MLAAKRKYNFWIELFLFWLAAFLFVILAPIGFCYALVKSLVKLKFTEGLQYMGLIMRRTTVALDELGNVVLGEIMNDLAKTSEGHAFGDSEETISSALGKNERDMTLTRFGRVLVSILSIFEYNHAIKSIEE